MPDDLDLSYFHGTVYAILAMMRKIIKTPEAFSVCYKTSMLGTLYMTVRQGDF